MAIWCGSLSLEVQPELEAVQLSPGRATRPKGSGVDITMIVPMQLQPRPQGPTLCQPRWRD